LCKPPWGWHFWFCSIYNVACCSTRANGSGYFTPRFWRSNTKSITSQARFI